MIFLWKSFYEFITLAVNDHPNISLQTMRYHDFHYRHYTCSVYWLRDVYSVVISDSTNTAEFETQHMISSKQTIRSPFIYKSVFELFTARR